MKEFAELPVCIVAYDIEAFGRRGEADDDGVAFLGGAGCDPGRRAVRLAAILSNLKSVLETGKPMALQMAPPRASWKPCRRRWPRSRGYAG